MSGFLSSIRNLFGGTQTPQVQDDLTDPAAVAGVAQNTTLEKTERAAEEVIRRVPSEAEASDSGDEVFYEAVESPPQSPRYQGSSASEGSSVLSSLDNVMPPPPGFVLADQSYRDEIKDFLSELPNLNDENRQKLTDLYIKYRDLYKEYIDIDDEDEQIITPKQLFDLIISLDERLELSKIQLPIEKRNITKEEADNILDHIVYNSLRYRKEYTDKTPENSQDRQKILQEVTEHLNNYYDVAYEEYKEQRKLFINIINNILLKDPSLKEITLEKFKAHDLNPDQIDEKVSNELLLEIIEKVVIDTFEELKHCDLDSQKTMLRKIMEIQREFLKYRIASKEHREYLKGFENEDVQGYFADKLEELQSLRSQYVYQEFDRFDENKLNVSEDFKLKSEEEIVFEKEAGEKTPLVESFNHYQASFDKVVETILEKIQAKSSRLETVKEKELDEDLIIRQRLLQAVTILKNLEKDALLQSAIAEAAKEYGIESFDKIETQKLKNEDLIRIISSVFLKLLKITNEKLKQESTQMGVKTILKNQTIPNIEKLIETLDLEKTTNLNKDSTQVKKTDELKSLLEMLKKSYIKKIAY
ncbi:MAG: hypothetical protein K1060chlam5_00030 [Candidatus Anoxychlamydiales bacterium]|nr:hypothetical protein [Candidatus Anoxychlamydiales bacterium]